jgi:cyclomaltodextrinase / maltogenic alpha-amylase / neopullulanase
MRPMQARAAAMLAMLVLATAAPLTTTRAGDAGAAVQYSNLPARASPVWLQEGVIYEIFPRVFSDGGALNGVTAQLDRLRALGVNILYLMPIYPQGKLKSKGSLGSPYAVRDYYAINPDYGTAADLKRLVAEAHKRGLRVIMDVVANHTSWDSVLMRHPEFYVRDATGHILPPRPEWGDVAHLDYRNPGLRRYMTDMLIYWLREFDVDGFRCDAAGEVPTDFWEQLRPELERIKPDLVMLAEWEEPELLAHAFNIDYSWTFYHAVADAILGRAPAEAVRTAWEQSAAQYERNALRMRFSDDQDELRAVARFGLPGSLAAAAIMLTMDGVPLLYNGMEVSDTAESTAPALFERIPIFWGIAARRPEVPVFYQQMIALRRAHPALTHGEVRWLRNSDERRIITFERAAPGERLVMAVNLSSQKFSGIVAVENGEYEDITPRWQPASVAACPTGQCRAALPAVTLQAWEFRIFRRVAPAH